MSPRRIQLRRTKGWRKPEGAVGVARPSRWGNPYVVGTYANGGNIGQQEAVDLFRRALREGRLQFSERDVRAELRGLDLCCYCDLDQPCHADVLLEIANGERPDADPSTRMPLRTWCGYDGDCWAGEPGHQRCDAHELRDTYEAALEGLIKSNRHVFDARAEVERLREERDAALRLLREEHEAHHPHCCGDVYDLCHIGQLEMQIIDREDTHA